ncbi:hypothetical protein, partial [Thioalkalivibrio denitrificans]|uniref:hypothetical protein n=1 Tax=Thioalkalivibrio denitrificans TaxID=108003 RepID=UPI001C37D913
NPVPSGAPDTANGMSLAKTARRAMETLMLYEGRSLGGSWRASPLCERKLPFLFVSFVVEIPPSALTGSRQGPVGRKAARTTSMVSQPTDPRAGWGLKRLDNK